MRLLLDTHVLLWALTDSDRLADTARALLLDPDNDKIVSAVSIWEIAIKQRQRRGLPGDMPVDADEAIDLINDADFRWLPITHQHARAVADLPEAHGDPFDRLLVAQAIIEPMRLLTADRKLAAYGDHVILV